MELKKNNLKKILYAMRYRLGMLIVFFLLSFISLIIMHNTLLEQAYITGQERARSYSIEEEKNLRAYVVALHIACQKLTNLVDKEYESPDFDNKVVEVLTLLKKTFATSKILPYAIINKKVYFINPELSDKVKDVDLNDTNWYNRALETNGEVIVSDAYQSLINNKTVITFAKASYKNNHVIAFDIFPEHFIDEYNTSILPPRCYYYLCDKRGKLLYTNSSSLTPEQLKVYIPLIMKKVREGKSSTLTNVIRPDGQKRSIYYNVSANGWVSIVTMPYHLLIEDIYLIGAGIFAIFLIFTLITIFATIHEVKLNQNISRTNDTIRVLGNSYYAIYRMNFLNNTYEMIKDSDDTRKKLTPKGNYDTFLSIVSENIEDTAKEEFLENFSAQNIKKLVSQRVRDYGGDFKRKMPNGELQWVSVRLLFDESLDSDEAVLCYRKIEDEKNLQLQQLDLLRSSLESAHQSEKARNMFFSSMSHDMRTPLNAIIGLSELALHHLDSPEKTKDYLNKINISSKHLLNLINDILELSRLEQGKMNVETKQINLKECIEENTSPFQSRAALDGKAFIIEYDIQDNLVYGDPFRLTQILNNLISNAFKFTNTHDKIYIRLKQLERGKIAKYQLEIEDTGIGMSSEFLEKIFIPYERESRFGEKKVSGTGLGTVIVKNIVSHLGGEITVTSEVGKGTTFTVTIPLEPVQQEEQKNITTENVLNANSLTGKNILLAEDNAINMEIAAELLSMHGMNVTKAWDGLEAVEQFKSSPLNYFDAILMDMQMPNLDGCEAAKEIRSLSRNDAKIIPIIAVTANAFSEDFAATSAAGMNAHVSKPIDFNHLCKTINELLLNNEV